MISPRWPFHPNRFPFYYGWVVLGVSTLGILCSIPGQTMGLAVFTDHFMEALSLQRTEISLAYLIGTVGASFLLSTAGRYFDLWGARAMIPITSVLLSVSIIFISVIDKIDSILGTSSLVSFGLITLGYFGARLFGQGVLTNCSRNVLLLWFDKQRGLAIGIRNLFVTFGFSIAPMLIGSSIAMMGWRETLWIMAGVAGIFFFLLSILFVRDTPESCGLKMDGIDSSDLEETFLYGVNKTIKEAKNSPVFWIYSLSLSMSALFGTALVFHIVSIFNEAGRDASEAYGYFFPAAMFATSTNFIASYISDRISLKPFLIIMLTAMCLGAIGFINLDRNWGYWILIAGFGVSTGLWSLLGNLTFVRFFGTAHLGEISGLSSSMNVFASAIGPAIFSLGYDFFGTYAAPAKICLVALILLLSIAIFLSQTEPSPEVSR